MSVGEYFVFTAWLVGWLVGWLAGGRTREGERERGTGRSTIRVQDQRQRRGSVDAERAGRLAGDIGRIGRCVCLSHRLRDAMLEKIASPDMQSRSGDVGSRRPKTNW